MLQRDSPFLHFVDKNLASIKLNTSVLVVDAAWKKIPMKDWGTEIFPGDYVVADLRPIW